MKEAEFVQCVNADPRLISRRRVLALGGIGALGIILSGCRILPDGEALTDLGAEKIRAPKARELESIDATYLHQLIEHLKTERSNKQDRLDAVRLSLRKLRHVETLEEGNALQIDKSGIYLTSKRVLNAPLAETITRNTACVINPQNSEATVVQGCIVHSKADLAVVYAPTGEDRRSIANLQFDTTVPNQKEALWMMGLRRYEDGLYRRSISGHVDPAIHFPAPL